MIWHFCASYLFFRQAVGNVTNARVNFFVTRARCDRNCVAALVRLSTCHCSFLVQVLLLLAEHIYFVHACQDSTLCACLSCAASSEVHCSWCRTSAAHYICDSTKPCMFNFLSGSILILVEIEVHYLLKLSIEIQVWFRVPISEY